MWRKKDKSHQAEDEASSASNTGPTAAASAPSASGSETGVRPAADLTAAVGGLNLDSSSSSPEKPNEDTCLAHLRLLAAFERLKTETGNRDGLWDLWDSRAKAAAVTASNGKPTEAAVDSMLNEDTLVKIREKRWALYVGRAVGRYAAWWGSFAPDMLLEKDMVDPVDERKDRYEGFTRSEPMVWNADMLPPLDVLLVWHAHMLNPRLYLEDCLRYGHGALWAAGIPWAIINDAIRGNAFQYVVSEECMAQWAARTGHAWRNEDDPDVKDIECPACSATVTIPWTTCGQPQGLTDTRPPDIAGEGYGDGHLSYVCPSCNTKITHDALRTAKFLADIQVSGNHDWAMPGTVLDLKTGVPRRLKYDDNKSDGSGAGCPDQLFPARLARRGLLGHVVGMLKPGSPVAPSMMAVRNVIEENFTGKFAEPRNLCEVMDRHGHKKVTDVRLSLDGQRQTRKMMSRYWENASPLAIDLVGCVMRQGVFSEKMCKLNWLNFPTARDVMTQLITKYTHFVEIVALAVASKDKIAVPTLDVDLAWHTHQLSPQAYYDFTVEKTQSFVDHNDKIDEDRLSTAFEWTSKTYQETFGEVYSECKCWYCETVRVMALPSSKMLGMNRDEKILEAWHASPESKNVPTPPTTASAHVSSHPAVHTNETTAQRAHTRPLRVDYRNRLEETHAKARKRVNKMFRADSGKRMGPRGEDTVPFWGKDIPVEGPWASSVAAATSSAMYSAAPGFVGAGPGSVGGCATGTCGGAVGCGSETLGMCSAGCVGSGWFGGNAGCAGFASGV